MNEYPLHTDVRCSVVFENESGVETNPTAVSFRARDPEGEIIGPYAYGVDAEIVNDAAGRYHVLVDANKPGTWIYRFSSTGTGKAADEDSFKVSDSVF